eukprot:GFUD01019970.1.p1 GENE.GFUD01019970.1~~GFUD01019970.1.p1  ORF type:complete len:434 (+),score=138.56 GFUD01019970.1:115-1416(+)
MSSDRFGVTVKKNKSRSRRAGLLFPVGRIHRNCRKGPWINSRIGSGAPVYLAAVMEYLAAEVLEQAGLVARLAGMERIVPRHIQLAVGRDRELDMLCKGVIMQGGGVMESETIVLEEADMAGDLRLSNKGRKHEKVGGAGNKNVKNNLDSKKKGFNPPDRKKMDLIPDRKSGICVDLTGSSSLECVIDLTGEKRLNDFEKELSRIDKSADDKEKKLREGQGQKKKMYQNQHNLDSSNDKEAGKSSNKVEITHKGSSKEKTIVALAKSHATRKDLDRVGNIHYDGMKNTDYTKDVPDKEDEGKKRGRVKSYKKDEHSSREDKSTGGRKDLENVKGTSRISEKDRGKKFRGEESDKERRYKTSNDKAGKKESRGEETYRKEKRKFFQGGNHAKNSNQGVPPAQKFKFSQEDVNYIQEFVEMLNGVRKEKQSTGSS